MPGGVRRADPVGPIVDDRDLLAREVWTTLLTSASSCSSAPKRRAAEGRAAPSTTSIGVIIQAFNLGEGGSMGGRAATPGSSRGIPRATAALGQRLRLGRRPPRSPHAVQAARAANTPPPPFRGEPGGDVASPRLADSSAASLLGGLPRDLLTEVGNRSFSSLRTRPRGRRPPRDRRAGRSWATRPGWWCRSWTVKAGRIGTCRTTPSSGPRMGHVT